METVIDKSRADPVPPPKQHQDNNGGGISPSKVTFSENTKSADEDAEVQNEGHVRPKKIENPFLAYS